jgi:hypothetical protein
LDGKDTGERKNDFTNLTEKKRTDQQIKKVFQFLAFSFIRFHNQRLNFKFGANAISTTDQSAASWSPIEAQSELSQQIWSGSFVSRASEGFATLL